MARTLLSIDGIPLAREEKPASVAELQHAVVNAAAAREPMLPVGGRTKLHLGNAPAAGSISVHTSGLSGIIEYEPDNMTVSVQAGTPFSEVQRVLAARRQFIPLDPPHPDRATVGGLISCNTSGPLRCRYGTIRDFLLGVKLVHADGKITKAGGKLVKNVTGYDMCKLYTGALGTLGILTEATFKLMPLPETEATLVLGHDSLQDVMETADVLIRNDVLPEALEAWNTAAFARTGTGPADSPWLLMLRIGDVRPALDWQIDRALNIAAAGSHPLLVRFDGNASDDFWRAAAGAREQEISGPEALLKCSVLPRSVAETAQCLEESARALGAALEIFGHVAAFVLYARLIWPEGAPAADAVRTQLAGIRKQCASRGGHVVAEKLPSGMKAGVDVWGYDAPALEIMRRIKREFDPEGLLNRGRFVGGI